jgi:ATP-binding cassette subfamily F protein 3
VTKIVELDAGKATVYAGNYTAYVKQREERRLSQMREYEQQQEMIERTEDFIRRNLAGQKTKQAKSRRNMLERLERVEAVREDRTGDFRLQTVARAGDNVLAISELAVGYAGKPLARDISFLLRRSERLGIIGPNGSGKTTFLKTIAGEMEPIAGGLTWGANVQLDYFDQELASLDLGSTVMGEIAIVAPRATPAELRSYLAKFLFTGDDIYKPIAALSGGEKSRVALAKLIYSRANVLVLDEPTNHLDIPSREALERALAEYTGTIITVSHDRYFLDKMATEILHFENGEATYHTGSYSDYYELRHRERAQAVAAQAKPRAAQKSEKPRANASRKPRLRPVAEIERDISALEAELSKIGDALSNPAPDWEPEQYVEAGNRQNAIATQLENLYQEWATSAGAAE